MVQEKVLGQGPQNDESAIEQAKDEQMSDFIRNQVRFTVSIHVDQAADLVRSTRARPARTSPLLIRNDVVARTVGIRAVASVFQTRL